MRRAVLAAVLGLAVGLGVLPMALAGDADAPSGAIVLRGSRSAAATIVLGGYTTLYTGNALKGERAPTATKAGRYAGYVLSDASGRLVAGGMQADRIGFDRTPAVLPMGAAQVVVAPGTYRLTLVADGVSEIRIPASGISGSLVATATQPAAVSAELRALGTGASTFARRPVTLGRATTTYVAVKQAYTGAGASQRTCIAVRGGFCATTTGTRERLTAVHTGAGAGETWSTQTVPAGDATPNGYDAIWQTSTAGVSQGSWGFVVTVG